MLSSTCEKAAQSPLHPCSPVKEPPTVERVRAVCARAWRMRDATGIVWGVRDWSKLTFEVREKRLGLRTKYQVVIRGALPGLGLEALVWREWSTDWVEVICEPDEDR